MEKQFNDAALLGSKLLYNKKVFDAMVRTAQKSPIAAIMNAVVKIIERVDRDMPGLPIDVLFGVGMALVVDAADAIQQSGVEVGEDEVSEALSNAITLFLQENPDRFSPQEIQDAVARLEQGLADLPDDQQPAPPSPKQEAKRGIV